MRRAVELQLGASTPARRPISDGSEIQETKGRFHRARIAVVGACGWCKDSRNLMEALMRTATLAGGVLAVCVTGGVTGALAQTLEGVSASNCNFANTVFGEQGQRQIQINLAPADQYNYGEVYGQIYFDFRRKGASQTPENWFAGFRRALVSTGLFSEDREYVLMVTAYGNLFDRAANVNWRVRARQANYVPI